MGTPRQKFTLLRFFRSINFFQFHALVFFLHLVVAIGVVTGTETELNHDVQQEAEASKPQQLQNAELLPPQQPHFHPIHSDLEDAQLDPFVFNPRVIMKSNVNEDDMNRENHILSRSFIHPNGNKRNKRQVQNGYDRFYLCMFTLFTNPNCMDQQHSSHNQNYGHNYGQDNVDNTGYVTFVPTPPPNNNQQGFGLFGSNGIFGGRFGQNNFNNYNPFLGQQSSTPSYNYYPPPQIPIIHQTPYPEQQIYRRPGPPPTFIPTPTTTTRLTTPTTYATTTTIKSTTRASTTTATPTTTTTTRRTTSHVPTTAPPTTRYPPSPIKVESVSTKLENSVDCENGTGIPLSTQKIEIVHKPATTPLPPSPPSYYHDFSSGIKTIANENSALKSEVDSIRQELFNYQEQNKYLQEAVSTLQDDNSKLKTRVGQLERTNNHLQQQNGQLQHSTGDMRTQLNEMRNKAKYSEDKMVKLARQGIEDQKQVTRLQNRVRDLNKENNECKSQLYQLQLRHTQRLVHETATSIEMEMQGSKDGSKKVQRFPQQVYRDDILSTSTEQGSALPQTVEYDDDVGESTTGSPGTIIEEDIIDLTTTSSPGEDETQTEIVETSSPLAIVVTPTPTSATEAVGASSAITSITPSPPENVTSTKQLPPSSFVPVVSSDPFESIFTSQLGSDSFAQHPNIFDDNGDEFGVKIVGEDDEDSNELSILLGNPDDPDRSIGFENDGQFYSPSNFDAFSSFNLNQRPDSYSGYSHPFNNYWPYQQYSPGMMGHGTNQNEPEEGGGSGGEQSNGYGVYGGISAK